MPPAQPPSPVLAGPSAFGSFARSLVLPAAIVGLALLLQLVLKPWLNGVPGGDFYAKLLLDIGLSIALAVSLTLVNGFTGQFSIGHAAFMAVGGYTAACITYYGSFRLFGDPMVHGGLVSSMIVGREVPLLTGGDLLFLASILAGGLSAAVCGYVVGLPSLRLKGDYLAIVTLGFGEIVRVLIQSQTDEALWDAEQIAQTPWWQFPKYLGGAVGFSGLPFYTSLFWVALATGFTLLAAYRIKRSTFGRAFLSIREDEIAAEAMGVNTTRYKVWAFVIAAFFAGVAGALFAHTVGVQLNAAELGFVKSFDIIIMVVLGGLGSISGAAIAAVFVTLLPEALRDPKQAVPFLLVPSGMILAFGAVMMLVARSAGRRSPGGRACALVGLGGVALCGIAIFAASRGVSLGDYRMIIFALALIAMMLLRPQGLLGVREVWEPQLWRGFWRAMTGRETPKERRP